MLVKFIFGRRQTQLSGSQRLHVNVCVCVCLLMQSKCVVCSQVLYKHDPSLWLPVWLAVFSLFIFLCSHRHRNNAMAERDSHSFLKRLLQINKNSLLKLHPFPASGSQNIKSLEAEINPTWAYCQDLGFSRDCHLSAYHQCNQDLTHEMNICCRRLETCNIAQDRWDSPPAPNPTHARTYRRIGPAVRKGFTWK